MELLWQAELDSTLRTALLEDIGHGDVTTAAIVDPKIRGRARIVVKETDAVFCGGPLLVRIFELCEAEPKVEYLAPEGSRLARGAEAMRLEGGLGALLTGERTVLIFAQLLCGIATLTRRFVGAIAGTGARIIDTRKTHPGLRAVEKYAVRVGGGFNHRFGLDAGVLIKENHIAAAGSVRAAFERAVNFAPHSLRVQVECETLKEVEEAVEAGATAVLVDDMTPEEVRRARALVAGRAIMEVSGGVSLETVRAYAETGVELISVGALTHSAKAADLSMYVEPI